MYRRCSPIAHVLCVLSIMLVVVGCFPLAAHGESSPSRVLKNPYAEVDWANVNHYLANFHSHTVYSDGRAEPDELIYNYANAGYHILAITDHDNHHTVRDGERATTSTASTTWPWTNWIVERPSQTWHHDGMETAAFFPDLGEQGMLAIRGNELSTHPHIVSIFNNCGFTERGQTDDERMACIAQKNGLAHWAHPANYVPGGRWEDRVFDTSWEEAIAHFGHYIGRHDHMIGVEVRFGSRREREEEFINRLYESYYRDHDIYIVGSDDTHATSVAADAALTLLLAEELTEEAVRYALERGHSFVGSRTENFPRFNGITVDDKEQQIAVDVENCDAIIWLVNGEETAQGATFSFADLTDAILRFQVTSGEAIFYSQSFHIE